MEALLQAKRACTTKSTRAKVAKFFSGKHHSTWAGSDIEKALELIDNEGKADIFVSLDGDMRDSWLNKKIASNPYIEGQKYHPYCIV